MASLTPSDIDRVNAVGQTLWKLLPRTTTVGLRNVTLFSRWLTYGTSIAEITGIAAADLVHDFLSMFVADQPPKTPDFWSS